MTAQPPGTQKPRRFVPRFHYELLVCGVGGHELLGVDAAELRPEDALFAREPVADIRQHVLRRFGFCGIAHDGDF